MRYGAVLDALRGVTWPARRPARGGMAGTHPSRLTGVSPEFTEYRPYRQGDDPRRLDWRLLARTDRAFLRITSDRATLGTALVVDASASMAFPDEAPTKWEHARALAVALASVAHASGDPVGLVVAARGGPSVLPPRTRRGVVGEMVRMLDALPPAGSPPLAEALALARSSRRVVVVSDFLEGDDALLRLARERIVAGAEVYALHVVARAELDPPRGAVLATDPERPEIARPLADETRAAYLAAFAAWREELASAWRGAGAVYRLCVTDERPAHAVRQIVRPPAVAARAVP
jgi:uncharacterized protein (DUF58 family)